MVSHSRWLILWVSGFFMISLNAQELHRAACRGDVKALDSLLQTADIQTKDQRGRSLLHYAVGCNQEKVLDYLLEKGIGTDHVDHQKRTPIYVAVQLNRQSFFDKLIKSNARIDIGNSLLHMAVLNEELDMVKQLVTEDIDKRNERGNTALAIALRQNSEEIVDFLIERGASRDKVETPELKGPYLGQKDPGGVAQRFAPEMISTEDGVHTATFAPDMNTFYYTLEARRHDGAIIMMTTRVGDTWTLPKPTTISGDYREVDPFMTSDGTTIFYSTNRPIVEGDTLVNNIDLWKVRKEGERWGTPTHLGTEVNTPDSDWFPTLAENGNLYFSTGPGRKSNIVISHLKEGVYQKAQPLSDAINSEYYDYDPFISPDETILIFASRRPDGYGNADLYVSFKNVDGSWTPAKNMGDAINTEQSEFAPTISPDGKFVFYCSAGDIYWIRSEILNTLRK